MGQETSKPHDPLSKINQIYLNLESSLILLTNIPRTLTVSSLLSHLNRSLVSLKTPIISLKTKNPSESINYYLSMPERPLTPLENDETLMPVYFQKVSPMISISSFEVIQVIGKGSYSTVAQVRKKDTGMIYALKSIEKRKILKEDLKKHILSEKKILSDTKSPFIVKLHWAFQTKNKLHFVMDFYPGGDLYFHMQHLRHFSEDQAKFYFAEVLIGLYSLHRQEIAYRDLKPENIVIDIDGHIRLTDFGLSRFDVPESSTSFCGSPEYMSPEMILGEGHNKTVDFYSLGTLLYEMITGLPPFYDSDTNRMHNRVLNEDPFFPETMSENCKLMLAGLLEKDPNNRLGFNGIKEVMKHPWCSSINWKAFKKKQTKPPFPLDLRKCYFDLRNASQNTQISDSEASDAEFEGFDFNLEVKNDEISRQYFEAKFKARSSSQKNYSAKKLDKKGDKEVEKSFTGRTGKRTKGGTIVLKEEEGIEVKKYADSVSSPREEITEKLKKSVYGLISRLRK